jgi:hypothetical protein
MDPTWFLLQSFESSDDGKADYCRMAILARQFLTPTLSVTVYEINNVNPLWLSMTIGQLCQQSTVSAV